jgi:HK97 gp10 family phage protein
MAKSGISGFTEASRVLTELPQAIEQNVLQQAALAGAGIIRDAIKERAPVGGTGKKRSPKSKEFGRLRTNLKVRKMTKLPRGVKGAMVVIGRAFWGLFAEYGTAHQAAKPFFRPGFDAGAKQASDAMGNNLVKAIEREAERLARKAGVRK